MTYQIRVISVDGNLLKFTKVKSYISSDGLIKFIDSFTGLEKAYPISKTQIEEEQNE